MDGSTDEQIRESVRKLVLDKIPFIKLYLGKDGVDGFIKGYECMLGEREVLGKYYNIKDNINVIIKSISDSPRYELEHTLVNALRLTLTLKDSRWKK